MTTLNDPAHRIDEESRTPDDRRGSISSVDEDGAGWETRNRRNFGRGGRSTYPRGNTHRGSNTYRGANTFYSRGANTYRGGRTTTYAQRYENPEDIIFHDKVEAIVDARIANGEDIELVKKFVKRDTNFDIPLRPGFGTQGTVTNLRTNFFPVTLPNTPFYEYSVAIEPDVASNRRVKHRIFKLAEGTDAWKTALITAGGIVHDNSAKIISAMPLPIDFVDNVIKVTYRESDDQVISTDQDKKPQVFELKITPAQSYEISTQSILNYLDADTQLRSHNILPLLSAVNLILSDHAMRSGVKVGRDRYFFRSPPEVKAPDLTGGLEAWKGYFSSVRPTFKQLMVNVDVSTSAFYTENVKLSDVLSPMHPSQSGPFCKGLRIETIQGNRYKKTLKGVSTLNAFAYKSHYDKKQGTEPLKQSKDIVDLFAQSQLKLHYPNMPLLLAWSKVKGKDNYLPAEICSIIAGQPFRGKLTDQHTRRMIEFARKPPYENAKTIVNSGLEQLGFITSSKKLKCGFSVSIEPHMAVVPARILPRPGIEYANQLVPDMQPNASWNLQGMRFFAPAKLGHWAVLLIRDCNTPSLRTEQATEILARFLENSRNLGMKIPDFVCCKDVVLADDKNAPLRRVSIKIIENEIRNIEPRPSWLMVMLSSTDKNIYEGLKHLCDVRLGIATSCVQMASIVKEKGQDQYFANVALKVNMKFGGINHVLDSATSVWLNEEPTMVVGMDVTHPGPGSAEGTPSIAAVVASVDGNFAQYPASLDIQKGKQEMIGALQNMMLSRLQHYSKMNNGILPKRILVYRDGVSEGQFDQVRTEELPLMEKAFERFENYKPKLTIVICGKRHHTKFYPTAREYAARDGNPLPGTVVDRGVTAIYDFDFFLQAHSGVKGKTADGKSSSGSTKSTHYSVVYDSIDFSADDLQAVTHALSYTFARATRAVSLVSPAYYADIACERGRCYLRQFLQSQTEDATIRAKQAEPGPSKSPASTDKRVSTSGAKAPAHKNVIVGDVVTLSDSARKRSRRKGSLSKKAQEGAQTEDSGGHGKSKDTTAIQDTSKAAQDAKAKQEPQDAKDAKAKQEAQDAKDAKAIRDETAMIAAKEIWDKGVHSALKNTMFYL